MTGTSNAQCDTASSGINEGDSGGTRQLKDHCEKQHKGRNDSGGEGDSRPLCIFGIIGMVVLKFVIIVVKIAVLSGAEAKLYIDVRND